MRVSLVTGGARGIGGATSRLLATRGDHVVVNDLHSEALDRTRADIEAAGGRCATVLGDITDEATVRAVVDAALRIDEGRIDVLVNNVGDFRPPNSTFLRSTPEKWRRLHELNLLHVFAVTHAVLPHMVERGRGAIVNNSTVEAFRGIPGSAVYSAYNAGVSAFTKSLAVEVGGHGIRVNAVAPDLTDTDQTPAEAMLRGRDAALTRTWLPLGRFGRAEECAAVIAFLASDEASFVTGHTIPVDGGTLAASGWYARVDGNGWTNLPDHA